MIYEFITPSDPITFISDDDKIAYATAILVGGGKAGCTRIDENRKKTMLGTMFLFNTDPMPEIKQYLGLELTEFIDQNTLKIAETLSSFAYGSISDRKQYQMALEAITDPVKLAEFKAKHEHNNRSSMSQWVQYAWKLGEKLSKKKNQAT